MTIAERRLIEQWKDDDKFNSEIASLLGKAPQTINTEIKRGLVRQQSRKRKFETVYQADYAQLVYDNNGMERH